VAGKKKPLRKMLICPVTGNPRGEMKSKGAPLLKTMRLASKKEKL